MNQKELIKYLSYDKMFGILTRPALELKIEGKVDACLIDFNNLKKLNQLLGYNKVNQIIFKIFEEFEEYNCICGRWFSGDEILIVSDNITSKIDILREIAHQNGMTFKDMIFLNMYLEQLEEKINNQKV